MIRGRSSSELRRSSPKPFSLFFRCRHIQDPASQRLTWNKPPVNVLVIRKIRDESLVEPFKELCRFLVEVRCLLLKAVVILHCVILKLDFLLDKSRFKLGFVSLKHLI